MLISKRSPKSYAKPLLSFLPLFFLLLTASSCKQKPDRVHAGGRSAVQGADEGTGKNQGSDNSGNGQNSGEVQNQEDKPIPWDVKDERFSSGLFLNSDLSARGPYGSSPTTLEYALPAARDTKVMADGTLVDVRGIVYLPASTDAAKTFPVIIIFTGNHSSCGLLPADSNDPRIDDSTALATKAACPKNRVEAPSHKGYEYLAQALTSWGYAVVSINPNRGVQGNDGPNTDRSLIEARAALLRKHITYLRTEFEAAKSLDFQQLGLIGHSRGGDAVRTFYNLYKEPDIFQVRAVYEIAPLDFGSGEAFDVVGVPWGVLIAGCDGDLFDYPGVNPFRRVLVSGKGDSVNSVTTIMGANHNFFNTEWQTSDSRICEGDQQELWDYEAPFSPEAEELEELGFKGIKGSATQRKLAEPFITTFFRANLGPDKDDALNRVFDPRYALPSAISGLAPVAREFIDYRSNKLLTLASTEGNVGKDAKELDPNLGKTILRFLSQLIWDKPSSESFYQANMWKDGEDLSRFSAINVPISRRETCSNNLAQEKCPLSKATSFRIQLVDVNDNRSEEFSSEKFMNIRNIVNRDSLDDDTIPLLFDMISLPTQLMAGRLKDIQGNIFDMTKVKALRFNFDEGDGATVFASKTWTVETSPIEYPKTVSTVALTGDKPVVRAAAVAKKKAGVDAAAWKRLKALIPASRRP